MHQGIDDRFTQDGQGDAPDIDLFLNFPLGGRGRCSIFFVLQELQPCAELALQGG
jgi:hypothetical protein